MSDETFDIAIVRGNASYAELAAVTAVLSAAIEEASDANARESVAGPNAWERSQRSLRRPLHPGPGAWRGFSA